MKKWLHEPLFHFLIFGLILFAGHALWANWVERTDRKVIVDTREMARQSDLFAAQNGRSPTEVELQGIIVAYVEEEVLSREAERLGLDQADTVIRRRLAQKMRLLMETGDIAQPDETELRNWFEDREADYAIAEQRTVQHAFFSDDRRDDPAKDAQATDLSVWPDVGDPFIVARQIGPVSRALLTQDYGADFAATVFSTEPGQWSEPVRSPFGVHRVRVTDIRATVPASFETSRDQLLMHWRDAARKDQAEQAMRELISHYDVIVEE